MISYIFLVIAHLNSILVPFDTLPATKLIVNITLSKQYTVSLDTVHLEVNYG